MSLAVDLQHTTEVLQMSGRTLCLAIRTVEVDGGRRFGSGPGPIVAPNLNRLLCCQTDRQCSPARTLLEPGELTLLRVERFGEEVLRRDMLWFHLPIVDGSIPDERFEERWVIAGQELRTILRNGSDVLVHCRGGLGRAGTIASRLLIELGMAPETAIARVRAARPGAIETSAQKEYVLAIAPARD
jgi:protein-tyrosine phosphatase